MIYQMRMPMFYMMVGLPGSGKSYLAQSLVSGSDNYRIHSSDALREELYGDVNTQEHNEELFVELHRRIKDDLRNGIDVVYDATNLNKRRRAGFLRELRGISCWRICMVVMTPYEQCLEWNKQRDRSVPEDVIRKMYLNWQPPHWIEGWDDIYIKYPVEPDYDKWNLRTLFDGENGIMNFQQENSHHSLTLGEHCVKAYNIVKELYANETVSMAALLHDIGKVDTKSRLNAKGEDDGNCHYYQHHCVGAYNSIFYTCNLGMSNFNILWISNLIYYHMHPYMEWKEKNVGLKWCKSGRISQPMYDRVMIIHMADKKAH